MQPSGGNGYATNVDLLRSLWQLTLDKYTVSQKTSQTFLTVT